MQFVLLAIFAGCSIVGLARPFVALMGLIAVTMINPGELYPLLGALRLERVLVAVTLLGLFLQPEKLIFPKLTMRLFYFWVAMFFTVPFSFWPGGAFDFTTGFGKFILYHFLIVNMVNTKERFRAMLVVFAVLVGWIGGGALYAYASGTYDANALRNGFERAVGLTTSNGDPNTLGTTLVVSLPLLVLVFSDPKKFNKLVALVTVLLSVTAVMLTGSRTSFANLCLLVMGFTLNRKTVKFLPVVLALAVVTWMSVPEKYKERYTEILDVTSGKKKDESYESHRIAREIGFEMFKDYPLTGVGAGQFAIAAGQEYWPGRVKLWLNPHNLVVQLVAELGIIGTICWIAFMMLFLKTLFRLNRELKNDMSQHPLIRNFPRACLFAIAGLFIAGLFGHNLYRASWYQMAAMTAALDHILFRVQIEKGEEPALLVEPHDPVAVESQVES